LVEPLGYLAVSSFSATTLPNPALLLKLWWAGRDSSPKASAPLAQNHLEIMVGREGFLAEGECASGAEPFRKYGGPGGIPRRRRVRLWRRTI